MILIDDNVVSNSNGDITKVKENVMKKREKRERVAQLLQACKCSKAVASSTGQRSMKYDELGDECQDFEDASSPSESEDDEKDGKNIVRYHTLG